MFLPRHVTCLDYNRNPNLAIVVSSSPPPKIRNSLHKLFRRGKISHKRGKNVFVSWWTGLIFAFQVQSFSDTEAKKFIYACCQIEFKHLASQTNKQCNKSSPLLVCVCVCRRASERLQCGQPVWSLGTFITHMSTTCTKFNGPAVNSGAHFLHSQQQTESLFFFPRRLFFSQKYITHPSIFFLSLLLLIPQCLTVPMCWEKRCHV